MNKVKLTEEQAEFFRQMFPTKRERIALTLYYGVRGEKRHTFAQVSEELAKAGYTTNRGNPVSRARVSQVVDRGLYKLGLRDCRSCGYVGAAAKAEHRLLVKKVGHVVKVGKGYRIEHLEIRRALEKWLTRGSLATMSDLAQRRRSIWWLPLAR